MRHRRGLLLSAVTLPAVLAMTATFPAAGSATLVKAVPIVLKTEQDAAGSRSFELTYRPRASAAVSDRGFAVRVYEQRSDHAVRKATGRRVAGTERLESDRGTLTLRWSGVQRMRNGRWGKAIGVWFVVSGTGLYADRAGRGNFVSDHARVQYWGRLITAI